VPSRSTVVLVPCPDYEPGRVAAAVREGLSRFDLDAIVREAGGKPILLKPNLLRPAPPEKGVTTHPSVFAAVASAFKERGARLTYGDSPNGVFRVLAAARACGLAEQAEALGIPLADFESGADVANPAGAQNKVFTIANGAREAGAIVNLPRLKTHGLCTMTGALKNLFGAVPGNRKMEFHIKCPDVETFSRMLVDLNALIPQRLAVLDAIRAMEGNGPGGGDLVDVGLLIFSDDPVAADAVGCRIMGIDPLSIHVIRMAHERGLGRADSDGIVLEGADIGRFIRRKFALPAHAPGANAPRFMKRLAKDLVSPRPVIDAARCVRCGECVEACPTTPKSLSQEGGTGKNGSVPRYDYSHCIRCYCCQETCRQDAIRVKPAPLGRLISGKA
jgi:uncharacterized protein (DUF362 family)/Pyruvate/2-oxoacid:ferredoxin oxidoreductase delta subunit